MSKFIDFPLAWHGKDLTIPANRVMGAIARVEDFVTLGELQESARRRAVPLGKISQAYAALLNYAGAREVTAEEVYVGMFGDSAGANVQHIQEACLGLMSLMLPPDHLKIQEAPGDELPGKNIGAAASSGSPNKPGKPRSRPGGARTKRSGR